MNSPVLLNGIATVSPGQSAEISDPTRLQNPFRTAMLIDEIRFWAPTVAQLNLMFALRADFRLGRDHLTSSRGVSIGLLSRNWNDGIIPSIGSLFTWKLPRPLYIPAGEYLIPKIYHDPDFATTGAQQLEVIYAGRSLPADFPKPKVIHLPYASQVPTLFRTITSSGNQIDETKESDIVNPFDEPLHVKHFIGRFYNSVVAGDTGGTTIGDSVGENTLIRAFDHKGTIMVKDSTPFSHLFSYPDRLWPMDTILAPKGYFIFQIERNYAALTGTAVTTAPLFSMIGYRDVPVER